MEDSQRNAVEAVEVGWLTELRTKEKFDCFDLGCMQSFQNDCISEKQRCSHSTYSEGQQWRVFLLAVQELRHRPPRPRVLRFPNPPLKQLQIEGLQRIDIRKLLAPIHHLELPRCLISETREEMTRIYCRPETTEPNGPTPSRGA
jgi:hypothetical protein